MEFEVVARTDTGRARKGNEDAVAAIHHPVRDAALLLVADGVGGLAAGAHASSLAVEQAIEAFNACEADFAECLDASFRHTSAELYDEADGVGSRLSGTTIVALVLEPSRVWVLHAGDSRAYRLGASSMEPLTRDHSWVYEQVEQGLMTEAEAEVAPQRNIITRCLGVERDLEIERAELPAPAPGDCFLLSSDGFHGIVRAPEMPALLDDGEALKTIAERCIELANSRGGPDNISVAIARVR